MKKLLSLSCLIMATLSVAFMGCKPSAPELLNVSYDPTRELYKDVNEHFEKYYLEKHGTPIKVNQSHGGSGAQSSSVINGLEADVVTLALAYDIDAIIENTNPPIIEKEWQKRLPNNSCPYTSTVVFLVRKGNPKNIKDWNDLIDRDDVQIITPNPKTSGGARWNFLAAYGYVLDKEFDGGLDGYIAALADPAQADKVAAAQEKANEAMAKMFNQAKVPVMDKGARGATNTFVVNQKGDVLLAWENEALLYMQNSPDADIEIVVPSISIVAEPPVSIVDANVDKKGTRAMAQEYLEYLYEPEAQEVIAKNFYRPSDESVMEKNKDRFPELKLFKIDDVFGGWEKSQKDFFNDKALFDQIMK